MSDITVTLDDPVVITVAQEDGPTIAITNEVVSLITVAVEGPQGPRGLQGAPGTGGDLHYTHNQMAAAATWNVAHNLGKYAAATIIDSAGEVVYGNIDYLDTNNVSISFAGAFSGQAFFN